MAIRIDAVLTDEEHETLKKMERGSCWSLASIAGFAIASALRGIGPFSRQREEMFVNMKNKVCTKDKGKKGFYLPRDRAELRFKIELAGYDIDHLLYMIQKEMGFVDGSRLGTVEDKVRALSYLELLTEKLKKARSGPGYNGTGGK
jgi:hypothetical protein